jgi:hypothetical protein
VEDGNGIRSKKFLKKEGSSINRDIFVFAFFLFLSFIFWYLNSLGKEIEGELKYPVRYVNPPKDRIVSVLLPSKLSFYLKGPGYSILKLKIPGNRSPVVIDFSKVTYKKVPNSNSMSYYIVTSGLTQTFTKQLRTDFEIISIKPDTIFIEFDRLISKKVPVVADAEVDTERQYFLKGTVTCVPDSIIVTGTKLSVDTVYFVKTRHQKFKKLKESVAKSVSLCNSKIYSISARKVSMKIPVEEYTEAEMKVPIKLLNLSDSLEVRIFPDVITVKCFVAVSDYGKVEAIPFNAIIDFNKIDLWSANKLQINVINVPAYVNSLRFTPQKVDFIIERKTR